MPCKAKMKRKAVALLSGGLDSTLAVKLMIDQGIGMTAVHFTSVFCNCTPKKAGCKLQAQKVAQELNVPIHVIHKGMDYIKLVERPPHGHGRGVNPCVDCRIYMLRRVKEMMPQWDAAFVITGEVLGQRPMSQHRHTLRVIERESGLEGLILRPLCARHFDPTIPEREGIVDRNKLLAFSGRSRKPQIELAQEMGIIDYPCPAGGCLLTDKGIAARLRDLFAFVPNYTHTDLLLLRIGRHYRLTPHLKVILGRDREENERLRHLAKPGQSLFEPKNFRGPTALAVGTPDESKAKFIAEMIASYSQDEPIDYRVQEKTADGQAPALVVRAERYPRGRYDAFRIDPG